MPSVDQNRMHSDLRPALPTKRLEEQPFGTAYVYPYESQHGVSTSMPTWKSTVAFFEESEKWKEDNIEWWYPRFFVNRPIRDLGHAAFKRLNIADDGVAACLLFPTVTFARHCARHIVKEHPDVAVDVVHFQSPGECDGGVAQVLEIAAFAIVVFPKEVMKSAMSVWLFLGVGMTTRHALFSKDHLDYLEITSSNKMMKVISPEPLASLSIPSWIPDVGATAMQVRSTIAELTTPEDPSLTAITAEHVTLYPTGMSAIWHASGAIETVTATSTVVAFGWMYDETIHNLKHGPWHKFIGYKRGTEQDLQDLTARLKAGERIGALFCELPSNVFLSSMPLQRLRALADEYGFVIACDDTVAGFINLDLMPYVDVMMTSLTKMFSGASNVMGGSVIVNPSFPHYDALQSELQARYDPAMNFPLDVQMLQRNSQHVRWRAQTCNANALEVAHLLHDHPLVERLNYPLYDESLPIYRSLMRRGASAGAVAPGYGPVLSVIFRDVGVAHRFYDKLNLPKGSSFGTNFTIAVPFCQLVHYHNMPRVAAHGLPKHIIRISVGLEDVEEVKAAIQATLVECGDGDGQPGAGGESPRRMKL